MDYPNVKEDFEAYISECPAYYTAYDHWLAGIEYADTQARTGSITLNQYLLERHATVKALTAAEAKILGIGYPLRHGWSDEPREINPHVHAALKAARETRYGQVAYKKAKMKWTKQENRK